jgi:flagellar hook-basal body complex protein FliE
MDAHSVSALRNYAQARPATRPEPGPGAAEGLAGLGRDFAATLQRGEEAAIAAMTGDADPHALVQALAQTELAVETAVTVRNKVVEAYQEILRMPV